MTRPAANRPPRNLGAFAKVFSTLLAIIPTIASALARALFGSVAYVTFGFLNIIRNTVGFFAGIIAEIPHLARLLASSTVAILGEGIYLLAKFIWATLIGFTIEFYHIAGKLFGFVVAALATSFNLIIKTTIFGLSLLSEAYSLLTKFLGGLVAVTMESLNLIRRILGAVVGIIAQIFVELLLAFLIIAALCSELQTILIRLVASLFGIVAEAWNLLRITLVFFTGLAVEVLFVIIKAIILVNSMIQELVFIGRNVVAFIVALADELLNLFIRCSAFILATLMEFLTLSWKTLIFTIGVIVETLNSIPKVIGASVATTLTALNLILKTFALIIAVLAEIFNLVRTIIALVIAPISGSIYGFFGGGFPGFKSLTSSLFHGISGPQSFGSLFAPIFNTISYNIPFLSTFATVYNLIAGRRPIGSAFSAIYSDTIPGLLNFSVAFAQAYNWIASHASRPGARFLHRYNQIHGNGHSGAFINNSYQFIRNETIRIGGAYRWIQRRFENPHHLGSSFQATYQYHAGATQFGQSFISNYTQILRLRGFGDAFRYFYRDTIGGSNPFGSYFGIYRVIADNKPIGTPFMQRYRNLGGVRWTLRTRFSTVYYSICGSNLPGSNIISAYRDMINRITLGYVFNNLYGFFSGSTPFGAQFDEVNHSQFFGEVPWWQQTVAAQMFKRISGFNPTDGFTTIPERIKDDFYQIRKHTDILCSGANGFIRSLLAAIPLVIGYPFAGVVYGAFNAGFPGAVIGFFSGIYKAITFAFRYSYQKANQDAAGDEVKILGLISTDWKNLEDTSLAIWETPVEVRRPLEPAARRPTGREGQEIHHYGPLIGRGQPPVNSVNDRRAPSSGMGAS